MGDYYSLRLTAGLNPEGARRVRELHNARDWHVVDPIYAEMHRASFIPYGALSYEPDGWEQANNLAPVQGVETWHVCCSIPHRAHKTLQYFLDHVLPPLLLLPARYEVYNEVLDSTETGFVMPDRARLLLQPETEATKTA